MASHSLPKEESVNIPESAKEPSEEDLDAGSINWEENYYKTPHRVHGKGPMVYWRDCADGSLCQNNNGELI